LQQAAFDELVYEVDIMRNVAIRRTQAEKEEAEREREYGRRPSLPVSYNILNFRAFQHRSEYSEVSIDFYRTI
jgi:hypothetical protein